MRVVHKRTCAEEKAGGSSASDVPSAWTMDSQTELRFWFGGRMKFANLKPDGSVVDLGDVSPNHGLVLNLVHLGLPHATRKVDKYLQGDVTMTSECTLRLKKQSQALKRSI